jgi:serine/threonine-protein kinase
VAALLRQGGAALAAARDADLVHRDIKPANLITCRYGIEVDFMKVLDFGLVMELAGAGPDVPTLTRADAAVGTPSFMAPEMAMARATVDGRADLYSLGCVAYWLLTGTLVFAAETAMEMVVMHARDDPEPPSTRTEMKIPADLEAAILACLEKDPMARPASATVLREHLQGVRLEQTWSRERRTRWWDSHRPRTHARK